MNSEHINYNVIPLPVELVLEYGKQYHNSKDAITPIELAKMTDDLMAQYIDKSKPLEIVIGSMDDGEFDKYEDELTMENALNPEWMIGYYFHLMRSSDKPRIICFAQEMGKLH